MIGLGLRAPHYAEVLQKHPAVDWFEIHSENFFQAGGFALDALTAIRERYPLSLHGIGLSLGSQEIQAAHLVRLKKLVTEYQPFLVSEHLSWGQVAGVHLPDLLPLPYTEECLLVVSRNVAQVQDFLGRELLLENPSSYLEYHASDMCEVDFLVEVCVRTQAKILLDVNNVFVSCENHGWNAKQYIDAIPAQLIKEIHLAGHAVKIISPNKTLRIDTHDTLVSDEVWPLYAYALQKVGAVPTLIEWDANLPSFAVLLKEASKARSYYSDRQYASA